MPLTSNKPIVGIFFSQIDKVGLKWPKLARSQFKKQVSKNQFFIDIFEKLDIVSKMYICEISKFKISGHKSQKKTILWALRFGTPIRGHPVFKGRT